jgi:hypothetical protein
MNTIIQISTYHNTQVITLMIDYKCTKISLSSMMCIQVRVE